MKTARNRNYYVQDNIINKQESLRTKDRTTAESLQHARYEAVRQPDLNSYVLRLHHNTVVEKLGAARLGDATVLDHLPACVDWILGSSLFSVE